MTVRIALSWLLIFCFGMVQVKAQQKDADKPAFYKAMESGNAEELNNKINSIKKSSIPEKEAYEGALLMKKADIASKAKEKLNLFKAGRIKLEAAIAADKENTEYRFLRLILQEHAPKIVKYRDQIEEDSKMISSNFKNLSSFLKDIITDYSKKSKFLKSLQP
jgi:hypothetical protein